MTLQDRDRHRRLVEKAAKRPRGTLCECCGEPPRNKQVLEFDHDHLTGQFRGWVCKRCNLLLGLAGDSIELLRRGALYLQSEGVKGCFNDPDFETNAFGKDLWSVAQAHPS